jgi:hypothetical protein
VAASNRQAKPATSKETAGSQRADVNRQQAAKRARPARQHAQRTAPHTSAPAQPEHHARPGRPTDLTMGRLIYRKIVF